MNSYVRLKSSGICELIISSTFMKIHKISTGKLTFIDGSLVGSRHSNLEIPSSRRDLNISDLNKKLNQTY